MKYVGRGLLLLLIGGLLWWFAPTLQRLSVPKPRAANKALLAKVEAARISPVYLLDEEKWTVFALPTAAEVIRVLTNANVPLGQPVQSEAAWQYAVQYRIVDGAGTVLKEQTYHHRTRLRYYTDPKTAEEFTASFYLTERLVATDGKFIWLNLSDVKNAAHVQFRLLSRQAPIRDVVLRLHASEEVSELEIGYLWRRLSETRKTALASGNVYPVEFLQEQEKRNLLRLHWYALGPGGVEGRDYQLRQLYVLREFEGEDAADVPVLPAGLFIDAAQHGTMPLPEGGGKIRLAFLEAPPLLPPPIGKAMTLRWYGRGQTERAVHHVPWQGDRTTYTHFFPAGLLEIIVPQGALVVRVFLLADGKETDITPAPRFLRTYVAQPGLPVIFDIVHVDRRPTPLRIDVRRQVLPEEVSSAAPQPLVIYDLLDAQGEVIQTGRLTAVDTLSRYDRVAGEPSDIRVTEVASYYFSLPAHITHMRFVSPDSAPPPLLLAAYNRPPDLRWTMRVPEDAYKTVESNEERQRVWFVKQPLDYAKLAAAQRSVLLTVQSRPPEDKPDILAGQYRWEDYHPQGDWLARHLLTSRDDEQNIRLEALPSLYSPVPRGQEVTLHFQAAHGLVYIEPQLAFLRQQRGPMAFDLYVDDQLLHRGRVAGQRGAVRLPPIEVGHRRVRLETADDARWLINYVEPGPGTYLKRLANRFDGADLAFVYDKQEPIDEVLSVRLHVPHDIAQRSRVLVDVTPPAGRVIGPLPSWTLMARRYDVQPHQGEPAPVLGTRTEAVDQGQPFFVPLGRDLPLGRYQLRFRLEDGPGGYLTLAKLTSGTFEHRTFVQENVARGARRVMPEARAPQEPRRRQEQHTEPVITTQEHTTKPTRGFRRVVIITD